MELPSASSIEQVHTIRSGLTISRQMPCHQTSGPSGDRMRKRYLPPARTSISQVGIVKPRGPHHRIKCCGSVQASKTRLRGASKIRLSVSTRSAGSVVRLVFASIDLLLHLIQTVARYSARRSKELVQPPRCALRAVRDSKTLWRNVNRVFPLRSSKVTVTVDSGPFGLPSASAQ